jgi:hypothetical protein
MNGQAFYCACCLAAALTLPASAAGADTREEFWPEFDAFFKLGERTRLFLMAAATRAEDTTGSGESTRISSGQVGAHLDFTLHPIWRAKLQGEDWERERYIWLRAGYRHLADFSNWSSGEDRGLLELHARQPLPGEFWLTNRLKWELRDLDGQYSNRYGVRLGLERQVTIGGHLFVPYFHAETLYDTRFDTWNRQRYEAGFDVAITHGWRIQPYLVHQKDSQSESGNVNAIGLTLKYSR